MRLNNLSPGRRVLLLATVLGAIIVALAAFAEGAIRFRQWTKHGTFTGIEGTFETDPETGLRILIPGKQVGPIRINSLGFRSPEINVRKPESTIRVAFLGGSTTYCAEVGSNELTWPDLVIQGLRQRWPAAAFDYINGGVPGYTVKSSSKQLRQRILALTPDVIVIYQAINDMSANSLGIALKRGLIDRPSERDLMWPSNYSLLWYLAEKNYRIYSRQDWARRHSTKLEINPQEFTETFRSDLTELVEQSKNIARLTFLVTQTHHLRRDQTPEQQNRAAAVSFYYMPFLSVTGLLDGLDAYNQAIKDIAASTGVELIEGATGIPGDPNHFVDSVHFSETGSRAMAALVLDALLRSGPFSDVVTSTLRPRNDPGTDGVNSKNAPINYTEVRGSSKGRK